MLSTSSVGYWVGVFIGLACSTLLCGIIAFVSVKEVHTLQEQMKECEKQVEELSKVVEEDRKIMQTYKFFNETWSAIIKMEDK